jgi:SulP family sulfate permease
MALAALGAAFGPLSMGLAILGAVVGCAVGSLAGSGRLVNDSGAALALLTAGLVSALVPLVPGTGPDAGWTVLVLVALAIAATGVLTILCGLLSLGAVVKFTPFPVRVGLSTGVGLLLINGAAPALLGHSFNAGWRAERPVLAGAAAVGGLALVVTVAATRTHRKLPAILVGLAAATLLHFALAQGDWGPILGRTVGVPELPARWFGGAFTSGAWRAALKQPAILALLGSYAVVAAIVVILDTLLVTSIIDGRLRRSRNANRELVAQGLSNLASAAVGGLPASPALPASLGLVRQRPARRHIVAAYALALLAVLLLAPQLLGILPVSAVGGVLIYLGILMLSPTLWQIPRELWRLRLDRGREGGAETRRSRHLIADWVVTLSVALAAVFLGIGHAVLIGASFAVLLFVRSNMRDVVRHVWTADTRRSLKTRPTAVAEVLRREGRRIALLELEGALFFGTADALRARLHALAPQVDTAILDLHQVREVDITAARILHETADDWAEMGKPLVFAECPPQDPRRGLIESVAGVAGAAGLHFEDTIDLALERAEDRLLERLRIERGHGEALTLGDTMIARGLSADELTLLAAEMTTHEFPRGHVLFRAGDPGDALYISLKGEIGLRVPGTTRRLASFAPGVTIGEMAVLAHALRSAEAVAETDVTALGMSAESFERLTRSHPALAAKLLGNIAVHLADRVRMLTGDLADWVSRASGGRTAAPSVTGPPPV